MILISRSTGYARVLCYAVIAVAWILLVAPSFAAKPAAQPTFASPEQAMESLVTAVRSGDIAQIEQVLGPGSEKLVTSGDPVADQNARERFLAAVEESSKTVKHDDGKIFFEIGKEGWPFPIPIVAAGNGWRFDAKAGSEEILNRRIGANELNAIDVCLAYVDAQHEYASSDRNGDGYLEYAETFLSDPGKHDGLYWPAPVGEEASPMGPLMAKAQAQGYSFTKEKHTPYYGYYYRILKAQGPHASGGAMDYVIHGHMIGGFALIAFPAQYGSSGIMTFIVNYEGIVYQKDLGPKTAEIAGKITRFDPDPSWKKAQ